MNEELKARLICSHFTMQHNSSRIAMESLILDASSIVDDLSNTMIASGSPSVQGVIFHDRNAAACAKGVAMRDENDVVVKEHGTLSEFIVMSDTILMKNL